MSTPPSTGKNTDERRLKAVVTSAELSEYRFRYSLAAHYSKVALVMQEHLQAYQRQLSKAYAMPPQFNINLNTGEVEWIMTPLEKMKAEQNGG